VSRHVPFALACLLIAVVFALELPFVLWRVRTPALVVAPPLGSVAVLLIVMLGRGDTAERRRWFRVAVTILGSYLAFALVVAARNPNGWNSLPEATGSLVAVVIALVAIVVVIVRTRPAKSDDPDRKLIQTWRARFR
jgi:hypothetical protein